jgi:hypothetical protein
LSAAAADGEAAGSDAAGADAAGADAAGADAAGADALGDVLLDPHALTSKMATTASAGAVRRLLPMNSSSWELP